MSVKKTLINFGDVPVYWIAAWHPCAPPAAVLSETEQRQFFKECVDALPPQMVKLLYRAVFEAMAEIGANEKLGNALDADSTWERVYLPPSGDPMLQ
jgi:hypothetical protein